MDDKTLLERAARAAGMWATDFEIEDDSDKPVFDDTRGFRLAWGRGWWNPLVDDGDALRLAVSLSMLIDVPGPREESRTTVEVLVARPIRGSIDIKEPINGNPYAATRRAIVRAAAAIHDAKGQP